MCMLGFFFYEVLPLNYTVILYSMRSTLFMSVVTQFVLSFGEEFFEHERTAETTAALRKDNISENA